MDATLNITFAYRVTSLGLLMVAATKAGICFAGFGQDKRILLEQLCREFPKARLTPLGASSETLQLDTWTSALNAHLSGRQPRPELPLDIRGTAFQKDVWECLLNVREGETLSYSELALRVGRPAAVRAAASACGRNRIAVLIPCHRVLRSDGSLGGYRWGLGRKQQLLEREASVSGQAYISVPGCCTAASVV